MNKQDWTYKTFGEVGTFLRGKSIQKADFVEKGMPCIHYGQIHTKFGVSIDKHLSEIPLELYNKSIIASHGDVIIAITSEDLEGSCKSTAWLGDYDIAVSSHAAVYKHNLNPKFIAYYLRSKSFYYEKMKYARGFKVMEIKPTDIERIPIPVPPIGEQERIVAELDLISGIIEKKKEQLKAYDQLAQSIFYTMFGDPIDNPKGWETKKLKDITTKIGSGATPKGGNQSYKNEGISLIRSLNVHNGSFKYEDLAHIDEKQAHQLNNVIVEENDVLFNITGASVARCCIVPFDVLPARVNQHVSILRPKKEIVNHVYLCYYLISPNSQNALLVMSKSNAATREALPKSMMEKYSICVPPLSLQQEFAEKVEAIERQKELVQQSIVETQTMFDCTMDKYFG